MELRREGAGMGSSRNNGIWEGQHSQGHSGLFQAGHFGGAIRGDTRGSPDVPPCPAGLIQRNCTKWGWSLPSPPYHSACQLETLNSNNDTEAKARGTPRAVGSCPHVPLPHTAHRTTGMLLGLSSPWGEAVPACPTPALPSPCPLTVLVLSLPERPFCHHEGALHLWLLHIHGSAAPGHRHLLLLQVGLGAAPAPWAGETWDKFHK